MSAQYDNTNRGVLFKNADKRDDRDPDYRGQINIAGTELWLDAWIQTAKKDGKKFMSLRAKPKQAQMKTAGKEDFDDAVPF